MRDDLLDTLNDETPEGLLRIVLTRGAETPNEGLCGAVLAALSDELSTLAEDMQEEIRRRRGDDPLFQRFVEWRKTLLDLELKAKVAAEIEYRREHAPKRRPSKRGKARRKAA